MANESAYSYQAPDQLVYNLLTGGGDRLGLLPTVEDYYRSQIDQLGGADTSPFTYTGERISGFSPREELAMQLADQGIGSYAPYLARSAGLTEESLATLAGGTSEAKSQLLRALQQGEDYTKLGIGQGAEFLGEGVDKASEAEQGLLNALAGVRGRGEEGYQSGLANILQGTQEGRAGLDQASPFFTQARAQGLQGTQEAEAAARRATDLQTPFLQEALGQVRSSTAGFDTADIDRFQNPFEEAVVQQTIKDLEKAAAQRDIASDAAEVTSGAFGGSRSRLGAQERQIAETRGLAEALAGIRGQGFTSARDASMGEFARQRGAEAGAGSQIAGLGAQAGSAQAGLAQTLAALGGQRAGFETGAGTALSNLAQQRYGMGTGTGQTQAGLASQSAASQLGAAQAGQTAKQATAATLGQAGQQLYGMGTGAGQQLYGMGTGAGQQLSGLAGQLAGGQQQGAQAMAQQAQLQPTLQAGDVSSLMQTGAMNRARNQAQMDLNYQNFVGQYNLPNQLLSGYANFLTGAGPLAGGTGYSGTSQQTPFGGGAYTNYGPGYGGYKEGGQPIPEGNKGLAALAKKAPEVVRKMGFTPVKKNMGGGLSGRFPRASRKLGA